MAHIDTHPRPARLYDAYIFDLDGTVYLGDALLPSAGDTIRQLRALGRRTVFLSNNPTHSRDDYAAKLTRLGLPTPRADIINSTVVMVDFLKRLSGAEQAGPASELGETAPGSGHGAVLAAAALATHAPLRSRTGGTPRLFVVGEEPLTAELSAAGFVLTDDPRQIDAVIASFDRTFVYRKLQIAFDAIRAGARFFATNGDRYCPVPGGGEPDAAAVIAAIEACTNTRVEAIVGKPSPHMVAAILGLLGLAAEQCIITGDRLETDVAMGLSAGMPAALTLTGATGEAALAASPIRPTYVLHALGELLPARVTQPR